MATTERKQRLIARSIRYGVTATFGVAGLALLVGGILLVADHGSFYYPIAGLALLATGWLAFLRDASPMTYTSPRSGRQFVVIAAGGNKALKTKLANKIVAFALPPR